MSTAEIFTQHAKDYYIAPDKEHFQRIIFDTFASKCTLWGYLTRQFQCITINCKICFRTKYRHTIPSNYRTYPYKRTVKQFRSLPITASVLFVYFFIRAYVVGTHWKRAYVVGTHWNCIDKSMLFKWVPATYAPVKTVSNKSCAYHFKVYP